VAIVGRSPVASVAVAGRSPVTSLSHRWPSGVNPRSPSGWNRRSCSSWQRLRSSSSWRRRWRSARWVAVTVGQWRRCSRWRGRKVSPELRHPSREGLCSLSVRGMGLFVWPGRRARFFLKKISTANFVLRGRAYLQYLRRPLIS
jgi:hypothetical protein